MSRAWLKAKGNSCVLFVYAQPAARESKVAGEFKERLKIKLKAAPIDGAANDELVRYLAKIINLPAKKIQLIKGETAREKTVHIEASIGFVEPILLLLLQ